MSLILHVSKLSDNNNDDDTCEITETTTAVNILPNFKTHKNDLSAIELSTSSSKYTSSGDDILSNISFDSNGLVNYLKPGLDVENEFNLGSHSIDRSSYIDNIMNSTAKDKEHSIGR
jgi:hypothetical protein